MSLADDLAKPLNSGCGYQNTLANLTTADADLVRAAVDNPAWGNTELSHKLKENDIDIPHQAISRHRLENCKTCL